MRTITVIVNPIAGRGRVKKAWPEVEKALKRLGVRLLIEQTARCGHAREIAHAHACRGTDMVVAVGGDGTAHEVANGILEASGGAAGIPFAIVPLGNGDDFVKMLPPLTAVGKQAFSWQTAIEKIACGDTAGYDAGRITLLESGLPEATGARRYFINGMNLGFTAHAAYNFSTIPSFLTGSAGYLAAVLKTLWDYPALELEMCFDGGPKERVDTTLAVLMNGRCFGHAFWVAPQADAADGKLEVMFTKKIGRLTILRKLPLIMQGKHLNDPLITWKKAGKVQIDSAGPLIVEADGECLFTSALRMEVCLLPGVLTMVV
ncbi:MAG: diacylglycerol/lipid kinase family protein [Saprospiraceae bacterium]|jgi:YegS/Rv2252/BmrU family lipid kinase